MKIHKYQVFIFELQRGIFTLNLLSNFMMVAAAKKLVAINENLFSFN